MRTSDASGEVSAGQALRVLRRRGWFLAQCAVVVAAIGVVLALRTTPLYEATATALVQPAAVTSSEGDGGGLSAAAAARLVQTRAVAERARKALGDEAPSVGTLLGRISAEADDTGGFVVITGRGDTPAAAARLANAVANEFVTARAEAVAGRIDRALAEGEQQLDRLPSRSREHRSLSAELADLRATRSLSGADVAVIDPAVAPAEHDELRPVRDGLIGALLGLLIGIVLVYAREALDPRVRTLEELRGLVDAPQLAALPTSAMSSRRREQPPVLRRARREPFEHLRAALLVFSSEQQLRRLVVTCPSDRREGKTVVAAGLSISLARMGLRVCTVDADLRHPGLAEQFGLDPGAAGLAELIGGAALEETTQRFPVPEAPAPGGNGSRPADGPIVSVIGAGREISEPAELLGGAAMADVLERLDGAFDVVIVDSPPILASSDALPLLERASGTILVARHFQTPRRSVARAAQIIGGAQGSVIGVVATGVPRGELATEGFGPAPAASAERPRVA